MYSIFTLPGLLIFAIFDEYTDRVVQASVEARGFEKILRSGRSEKKPSGKKGKEGKRGREAESEGEGMREVRKSCGLVLLRSAPFISLQDWQTPVVPEKSIMRYLRLDTQTRQPRASIRSP